MPQNQNLERKFTMKEKIKKHLARGLLPIIFASSVLGTSGCATTSEMYNTEKSTNIDYSCLDLRGEYKLTMRDNDVYLEKIDGSEKRQITHTPEIKEHNAVFSGDGNYIIFIERYQNPKGEDPIFKYFLTKKDSDDSTKKEISINEAYYLSIGK
jgi:hypothetical protein